jgi:predicted Holliday junction resolvase-like endonuclease
MKNLVNSFQEMKRIHGFCPCCGELFRLSDATLFTREAPPKTPFDRVADAQDRLARAIEQFEEREHEIRMAATQRGQRAARKRLKRIAPFFVERRIVPQDVKVIFSPVNYVVFQGMTDGEPKSIDLIDGPAASSSHEKAQKSIERAIQKGNLEWQTFHIDREGRVLSSRIDKTTDGG